jgi:hypothetical protein
LQIIKVPPHAVHQPFLHLLDAFAQLINKWILLQLEDTIIYN